MTLHPYYITDEKGNKVSVVLSIQEYEKLISELDDTADVKLFDDAKKMDKGETLFNRRSVFLH